MELVRYRPEYHYVSTTYGRSAFKQIDIKSHAGFGPLAERIIGERRTLLHYDRLFTLYQCLENLARRADLTEINIAEAGVYKGGSTAFMAASAEYMKLPNPRLFGFDTFSGHAPNDLHSFEAHTTGTFQETSLESVERYVAPYPNVSLFKGRIQDNAESVMDRTFHLVHLDVDIYEPTVFGLNFFHDRLVAGGMVVVDDYGFVTCEGARRAVDEFTAQQPGYFSCYLLSGQALLVKLA